MSYDSNYNWDRRDERAIIFRSLGSLKGHVFDDEDGLYVHISRDTGCVWDSDCVVIRNKEQAEIIMNVLSRYLDMINEK